MVRTSEKPRSDFKGRVFGIARTILPEKSKKELNKITNDFCRYVKNFYSFYDGSRLWNRMSYPNERDPSDMWQFSKHHSFSIAISLKEFIENRLNR